MPTTYHTLIKSSNGIDWVLDDQGIGSETQVPTWIHKSKYDLDEPGGPWLIGTPYGAAEDNKLWYSQDGTDFTQLLFTQPAMAADDNGNGFWTLFGQGYVDTEARDGIWTADSDDVTAFANIPPFAWSGYGDPASLIPSVIDSMYGDTLVLMSSQYGGTDPYFNAVFKSDDSEIWTRIAVDKTPTAFCSAQISRIVATVLDSTDNSSEAIYSDDEGDTWSVGTLSSGVVFASIAYSDALSLWVGVGADYTSTVPSNVWTSDDGETWVSADESFGTIVAMGKVIWNSILELFVAVGTLYGVGDLGVMALIATSPDGVTWTTQTTPGVGGQVFGVDFDKFTGEMYAVGLHVTEDPDLTEIGPADPSIISISSDTVVLSTIRNTKLIIDDERSTAPHGVYFQVKVVENVSYLRLFDTDDDSWEFKMVYGFQKDDVIYGSSDTNNQYLYLKRGDTVLPIINSLTSDSNWPIIFPGENRFEWEPLYVEWVQVWYYPTYWGV